jgi:hypothetical protein
MSATQLDNDLLVTLAALETHRVEFVLVGDVAAAVYDESGVVSGVAIVPGGYARNVERLSHTLVTLNAELGIAGRPDPRGLDWRRMDLREIAPCSFMTAYADVDVDFQPAGTDGYRDLFQDADRHELGRGARPYVVSPEDLNRVRRGAGTKPVAAALASAARVAPPASPPAARAALPTARDDHDPGIWTEEEFRAIRSGRLTF